MTLYEITTGAIGESYVRAYVWARDDEAARKLFYERHPGEEIRFVEVLLAELDGPFVTQLSDSGFVR